MEGILVESGLPVILDNPTPWAIN